MEYKYNFFKFYASLEQIGINRAFIRKNLSRDLGIIPSTLRRWEKIAIDSEVVIAKSHIVYCCGYFKCTLDEFVNKKEVETAIV